MQFETSRASLRSSILPSMRTAIADLWYLRQRVLHPWRRATVRRKLSESAIRTVLFVCHGNICRSPFGASSLTARASLQNKRLRAVSAGFVGPDRSAPDEAIAAAAELGYDLTRHRSALLTPELVGAADLIIVMSTQQRTAIIRQFGYPARQIVVLGDLDPHPVIRRTIQDPWGTSLSVFHDVYSRIDRCVLELTRLLSAPSEQR